MQISIYDTEAQLARATAKIIADTVVQKPNALLCLAGGDTPRLTYQYLVEMANAGGIDFSAAQFVSLDEWVGIPPSNPGSCYYSLNNTLFAPLGIAPAAVHFFDANAADLEAACKKIDNIINKIGGIDVMLVGIGMNGHIGFNEPGTAPDQMAHVVELDTITQQVGQKYFNQATVLKKGITLGIKQLMQSTTAILLASGERKAAIIKKALQEKTSPLVPASYLQQHANGLVMLDTAAAGELQ